MRLQQVERALDAGADMIIIESVPPMLLARKLILRIQNACVLGVVSRAIWSWGVRMPERATGGDAVGDELFDLFEFRKAALLLPRPQAPAA
jgi:hypothetical protein